MCHWCGETFGEGGTTVPADLIDRAAQLAYGTWSMGVTPWEEREDPIQEAWRSEIRAVAPLLVEHGRQQEKARWEARIEKLDRFMEADERDHRTAANLEMSSGPCDCSACGAARRSLTDAADLIAGYRARLRSLLIEEGENGE